MEYYLLIFFTSLGISLIIGNPTIELIKKLGARQTIREEGPEDHIKNKSKTPTIGGIIFVSPVILISLAIMLIYPSYKTLELITLIGVTLSMFALGFADDYLKVKKKHNKGITGWTKLFIQLIIAVILFLIYKEGNPVIFIPWIFFVFAGACNSYNLTDGLDGLASSISLISFLGFSVLSLLSGQVEIFLFSISFIASLLGFLYFNKHPAKIFMGDTGSLAIGGAIGGLAIILKAELYLILFATIPILEAISVIIQVTYFKITKKIYGQGKKLFNMTPIHHHFELAGWSETTIVKKFFIFQLICACVGIYIAI